MGMDMQLLDAWVLRNERIPHPFPDSLYFDAEPIRNSEGTLTGETMYSVTQFSSAHNCQYEDSDITSQPVCVVRHTNPEVIRRLWNEFIADGWVRVASATALECDLAARGIRAKEYRNGIVGDSVVRFNGTAYGGQFAVAEFKCDPGHRLYFPKNFLDPAKIDFHPVTHMPMSEWTHVGNKIAQTIQQVSEQIRQKPPMKMYGTIPITVKYTDTSTPNTQYALEA